MPAATRERNTPGQLSIDVFVIAVLGLADLHLALQAGVIVIQHKIYDTDNASEPYAAEAPPVTTSTRFTSALGKVLMSGALLPAVPMH